MPYNDRVPPEIHRPEIGTVTERINCYFQTIFLTALSCVRRRSKVELAIKHQLDLMLSKQLTNEHHSYP